MIPANKLQKQQIAILTKNDQAYKKEMVIVVTGDNNKGSTNDLTFEQANVIIELLGGNPVNNRWAGFNINNIKDRKILSLCHQYGWETYKNDKIIADTNALANWLYTKSPVNKPLSEMQPKEKDKVIFALENMVDDKNKKGLKQN